MNKKACLHNGCKLPVNNNRYLLQGLYVIFGLAVLCRKMEQFTFFQVGLFIFPILIDISYGTLDSKIMDFVRKLFLGLNIFLFTVCMLGLVGIVSDTGDTFFVKLEVFDFRFSLTKAHFGMLMSPNIAVPFLYYGCSPCRKNETTITSVRKREKGVVR